MGQPPQQQRSRVTSEKILEAAEELAVENGLDDLTMAGVATVAGVSVGAIYRLFDGKHELLAAVKDRMLTKGEEQLTQLLKDAEPSLVGMVKALVYSLVPRYSRAPQVLYYGYAEVGSDVQSRGVRALYATERIFLDAAVAYVDDVRRRDRLGALVFVAHTAIGACGHRSVALPGWSDGLSWQEWASRLVRMLTLYLLTPEDSDELPQSEIAS